MHTDVDEAAGVSPSSNCDLLSCRMTSFAQLGTAASPVAAKRPPSRTALARPIPFEYATPPVTVPRRSMARRGRTSANSTADAPDSLFRRRGAFKRATNRARLRASMENPQGFEKVHAMGRDVRIDRKLVPMILLDYANDRNG